MKYKWVAKAFALTDRHKQILELASLAARKYPGHSPVRFVLPPELPSASISEPVNAASPSVGEVHIRSMTYRSTDGKEYWAHRVVYEELDFYVSENGDCFTMERIQ